MHGAPANQQLYEKVKKKTPTQRTKCFEHLFLETWGDFLKNWRAQRLGVYRGFMKKGDKHIIQNITQRKAEQTENEPILSQQTTFQKTVGPNGTVISMVS